MRSLAVFLSALLTLSVPSPASTQTSATQSSPAQAISLLQQSLAALVGNTTLSDITLTGSVRRIAGSDDETGTATLQAVSNGSASLKFDLSTGFTTEISNLSSTPSGAWSGPDGVQHPIAVHNLLPEPAWFAPALAIERRLSMTSFSSQFIANETLNGQAVEHISVSQTASLVDPPGTPTYAHLTQVDFYLDSTTHLPVAIFFNMHPDNNVLLDLPVQVLFSDYRSVSGVQIPFHVQKFFNNSLSIDLQFQSASINSGVPASAFSL